MKKTAKVRRFLDKGLSASEIAKKLNIRPNYVYTVKWLEKKKADPVSSKKYKKPSKIIKAVKEMDRYLKDLPKRDKKAAWPHPAPWAVAPGAALKLLGAKEADLVNHPPHYKAGGIETLDFIEAKDLNFRLGNVVKYVSRAGKKPDSDPVKDLEKAAFYLKREIDARKRA